MRKWLHARLKELADLAEAPEDCLEGVWEHAADIIREASDRAARAGLPELVERSRRTGDWSTPGKAKVFLAECLAALDRRPASHLTVAEAARHLRAKTDTVRAWINAGRLKAANTGQGSRPRWRIAQADLDLFLAGRTREPRERQRQKAPPPSRVRYFPET
jgi:excisionase family DNA binding protein